MPSVRSQLAAPAGGEEQVPLVAPVAMVQMPPQQSVPMVQVSPFWPQNEGELQMPPEQSREQHSAPPAQALPRLLHVGLSGTHMPPVQLPLQQSELALHAWLSEVHGAMLQTPPAQLPEQQSSLAVHAAPSVPQLPPSLPPVPPSWAPVPVVAIVPELLPPLPPVPVVLVDGVLLQPTAIA
jgi:hypothetical protein